MNREDFPILNNNFIYFDNSATTLKPKSVVDEVVNYYTKYTANAHRGDYDNSLKVDTMYEGVRDKVKDLINANRREEIIFTSGTTMSINMIVFGFLKKKLNKGDEVLLTKTEHASNVLPFLELEKELGIKVKFIKLDKDYKVTLDNVKDMINENTKVISLAHITNTIGDIRPIKEITEYAHSKGIYVMVDGAQSIPHRKVDVKDLDIDFLSFSAHKMLGPTGVGVLYGKYELLDEMTPLIFGGGMNNFFEENGDLEYKMLPTRLEAGTPNIAGVIGFGSAIDYINSIGYDSIIKQEENLRDYLISKLKKIDNVIIYNETSDSGIILFNLKDVFAQDTAVYLNNYNICVRAGNHCAKLTKDELGIKNTCRISLYFYNTKEEIDKLITALENSGNIFREVL